MGVGKREPEWAIHLILVMFAITLILAVLAIKRVFNTWAKENSKEIKRKCICRVA